MPVEHSPARAQQHPSSDGLLSTSPTQAELIRPEKLSVLRCKRTKLRKKTADKSQPVTTLNPEDDEERTQLVATISQIKAAKARLSLLDRQIVNHPDFASSEETEIEETETWMDKLESLIHLGNARLWSTASAIADDVANVDVSPPSCPQRRPVNVAPPSGGGWQPSPSPPTGVLSATAAADVVVEPFGAEGQSSSQTYRIFRAQFSAWLSRHPDASQLERLLFLISKLRGPPRALIASLEIVDANFDVALRLLDENYGRSEHEQRRVLERLNVLPKVRAAGDDAGLRALLHHIQTTTLQLEALKVQPENYALSFENSVRKAIPASLLYEFDNDIRRDQLGRANDASSNAQPMNVVEIAKERLKQLTACLLRYTAHLEQTAHARPACRDLEQRERRKPPPPSHDRQNKWLSGSRIHSREQWPSTAAAATAAATATAAAAVRPLRRRLVKPCFFCDSAEHRPSRCTHSMTMQQRKAVLDRKGKCHVCFAQKHASDRQCEGPKVACGVCSCRSHYTSMHQQGGDQAPSSRRENGSAVSAPVTAAPAHNGASLVMTASAFVLVPAGVKLPVRVFVDPGSMLTFVSPALIAKLPHLKPAGRADLTIKGVNSEKSFVSERYRLTLVGQRKGAKRISITAYGYEFGVDPPNSCASDVISAIRRFGEEFPLADLTYANDAPPEAPSILLGMDYFYDVVGRSMKNIMPGLVATESMFGWLVGGAPRPQARRIDAEVDVRRAHPICCAAALSKPARDIERLWTIEAIGITDAPPETQSVDEIDALQQFKEGLVYDGKSYTVTMPKRASIATLANNLDQALRRLESKRRSLAKNPAVFTRYDTEIMSFVNSGFAERVDNFDIKSAGQVDGTYVMPHHQVVTKGEGGSEKWRIVFDCSAAAPGNTSLNSHLLPGPNENPDIVQMLLNFRTQSVAVSADVARAYMMINIHEADRPFFRFLWQGPNDTAISCYQMKRVTWGAAPSGFVLAATLRHLFERVDPTNSLQLGDCFYHDDMLRNFATDDEAIRYIDNIISWLDSAGMQLAKWKSNSPAVIAYLRGRGMQPAGACLTEGTLLKVLGIVWTPTCDELRVPLAALASEARSIQNATKRSVLRFVASIFDPVGWLLPFTLRGKLLIQQLWTESWKWDDPLPENALTRFREWAAEVEELKDLRISRPYYNRTKPIVSYHLHIFGDASETAYAAVAYLQSLCRDGTSQCSLLMAKSRLAPRKQMTLPRLELMAALATTRLRTFLLNRLKLKIDSVTHYTDSTTVYWWCAVERPSRWKEFVCNRVTEIQRASDTTEWFHVDGIENVADFATRGVSAEQLKKNQTWWRGPSWFSGPPEQRPCRRLSATSPAEVADSTVANEVRAVMAPAVTAQPCVDLDRFSSLEAVLRIISRVLTVVSRMRKRPVPPPSILRMTAEKLLVRWTQEQHLQAELATVRRQEELPRTSPLAQYQLFIDDEGLLRMRTRLTRNADIPHDEANPIVVPGHSLFARLLIMYFHRINAHFGVNVILSALRRRYWLTRARQVIKSILHRCSRCRRSHGSAGDQIRAPLPRERTTLTVPFASTGLDYCGAFYVSQGRGKPPQKVYIALFTCMAVRAVHLEVVPSMSTPSTHFALRRFLAARPGCTLINTDNFRSFGKAATDIKRMFNSLKDPECHELLAKRRIRWTHNCPKAAWHGGYFERLVRTVKTALVKTLGKSLIGMEEFRTIVSELAAVINDRPLTYLGGETDVPRPVTPAHFLHGGPVGPPLAALVPVDQLGPAGSQPRPPLTSDELRDGLLRRTNYFKALSVRWYREYLLQLRSAHAGGVGRDRTIKVGDVCLLKDDNLPRIRWKLVRITAAFPGLDGNVRTYGVRFPNQGYETRRPAQLLYPLEVVD